MERNIQDPYSSPPYPFFTGEIASHSPALHLATDEPVEQGQLLDGDAKHSHTPVVRALEYPDVATGQRVVDVYPLDPFPDTIRESDVPARVAQTRFDFKTEPWAEEVMGFMGYDRSFVPRVDGQPVGEQWPLEEHRPLSDGSHG